MCDTPHSANNQTAYTGGAQSICNDSKSSDFSSIHTFFEKKAAELQRNLLKAAAVNNNQTENPDEFVNYDYPAIIHSTERPYENSQTHHNNTVNNVFYTEPAVNSHREHEQYQQEH